MNTRYLFIFSLIVAVIAGWFYRSQGELDNPINTSETNIEYQATDILAIQTNEQGVAEYSLTADDLTHYSKENFDKLLGMRLNWRPSERQNVVINADEGIIYHEQNKVEMINNVVFASEHSSNNQSLEANMSQTPTRPPLRLTATKLTGDLNTNEIYSNQPIKVTQGDNSFNAQSFKGDMKVGDYEFEQVSMTFLPPQREDKPLF